MALGQPDVERGDVGRHRVGQHEGIVADNGGSAEARLAGEFAAQVVTRARLVVRGAGLAHYEVSALHEGRRHQ